MWDTISVSYWVIRITIKKKTSHFILQDLLFLTLHFSFQWLSLKFLKEKVHSLWRNDCFYKNTKHLRNKNVLFLFAVPLKQKTNTEQSLVIFGFYIFSLYIFLILLFYIIIILYFSYIYINIYIYMGNRIVGIDRRRNGVNCR